MQRPVSRDAGGLLRFLANGVALRYHRDSGRRVWRLPLHTKKESRVIPSGGSLDRPHRSRLSMRGRTFMVAAALGGLVLGAAGCQGTIDRLHANYAVKQGDDFYKAQDFPKAIEWYHYGIYLNPYLALAYYHTALANMALYKPGSHHPKDVHYSEDAIQNLKRYLGFNPDHEDAKNYLLTVLMEAERYDDAAQFFEKEYEAQTKRSNQDPKVLSALMQRIGMIYAKKGDLDGSLEWYKKRADLEKDNEEALYTIGVLCWDKVYHAGLTLDLDKRKQLIDMGLDYLQRAAGLRANYFEALSYVNLMYREKAKVAQ